MVYMNTTDNEIKQKNEIKDSCDPGYSEDSNTSKHDLSKTKSYNPFGLIDAIEKNKKKNTSSE